MSTRAIRKATGPLIRDLSTMARHVDKLEAVIRDWTKYGARIPKKPLAYHRAMGSPLPAPAAKAAPPAPPHDPRPVNPMRVQRQRTKGWRAPEGAVYVGRATCWGNPYEREQVGSSDLLVALYRDWIKSDAAGAAIARRRLHELQGKKLMCWCRPDEPCHADVLLELANAPKCEAVAA